MTDVSRHQAPPPDSSDQFVTGDMDVGGTFTDGFFTHSDRTATVKVETTPHDLTVCFWHCLQEGAARLGFTDPTRMLARTIVLRFATTVGTNAILQGTGIKLGMLVTKGEEERIYAGPSEVSPLRPLLVGEDLVIGVIDRAEGLAQPELDEDEVRLAIKDLLARGARRIVVALAGDGTDGAAERAVRDVVRQHYPPHYLGSVPLVLSSEVRPRIDDFTRANIAAINAYLTPGLSRALYRAEDRLRTAHYPFPLLITHSSGGAARVAKTRAIDTYNSGPSAGLFGCARWARTYEFDRVITVDIGGTSTDLGLLLGRAPVYDFQSSITGIPVGLPLYRLHSIGAGGGSIAKVGPGGSLTVGPTGAGAVPGPASYGLGGTAPTVTDAALVLGHVDPNNFLGGRRRLDRDAARRAIKTQVADPLQMSAEAAAQAVIEHLGSMVASEIRRLIESASSGDGSWRLFVFGGAGGMFAAQLAAELDTEAWLFRHGSVFNAFGSSGMDVVHIYEQPVGIAADPNRAGQLARVAHALEERSQHDMRAEGFPDVSNVEVELELTGAEGASLISAERATSWDETMTSLITGVEPGTEVSVVRVRARAVVPHPPLQRFESDASDPSSARRGSRPAWMTDRKADTPLYSRDMLRPGNIIVGPALIEAEDTSVVLPTGFEYEVDTYRNARVRRVRPRHQS